METVNVPGGNMNIGTSLPALNAFTSKMNVTAQNLANVSTDGYKSSRVTIEGGQGQTVRANVTKDNSSGPMIPDSSAENGVREMSNVDMVKEMLQLIPTQRAYDANLKVIQTNLEMRGSLINMTA